MQRIPTPGVHDRHPGARLATYGLIALIHAVLVIAGAIILPLLTVSGVTYLITRDWKLP